MFLKFYFCLHKLTKRMCLQEFIARKQYSEMFITNSRYKIAWTYNLKKIKTFKNVTMWHNYRYASYVIFMSVNSLWIT